jgi:hypothetical protein
VTEYKIVNVPDELWRKVKARAALEGVTLQQVLHQYLETYGDSSPGEGTMTVWWHGYRLVLPTPGEGQIGWKIFTKDANTWHVEAIMAPARATA